MSTADLSRRCTCFETILDPDLLVWKSILRPGSFCQLRPGHRPTGSWAVTHIPGTEQREDSTQGQDETLVSPTFRPPWFPALLTAPSFQEIKQPVGDTKTQLLHLCCRLWARKTDGSESPIHRELWAITKL